MSRFWLASANKVFKLLNGLSSSKATGLDKTSSKVLKAAACTIAPSLTYIFNNSILTCCFTFDWKMARLLPVYKKGPRSLPENYRPISILPAASKLMERIIYDQLYRYFNENSILSKKQFGFLDFHSTASALLDGTNSWYVNMDRKLYNKMSSERNVKCSIPQGSILGPLLFLIYIKDLPESLNQATSRLFADDTNLTVAGETIEEVELAMNNDLARRNGCWPIN